MYGGDYREWDCKGCDRNIRPESADGRKKREDFAGTWNRSGRWHAGRRMQRSDPCVPQVHHDGPAICIDEICHDHGWKDCNLYRSIQMDYRGKGACLCAGDAQ